VERDLDKQGSDERPGLLGGLAQRLQEGVRATVEALGQSHAQRLAAIVEASDDAILSVDLDGIIATWNAGAAKLLGYAPEEVIGQSMTVLIPADRQDEEPGILERIRRGEDVKHYETVRLRKDGHRVPISLSVSPIMDTSGAIIGAAKIARDITERRRAEEQQAALYEFTDRLFRAGAAEETYNAALDAIVRALGCERASMLMFDASGVMKFVAWRGLSDDYRRAVEGHTPWARGTKDPQPITIGDIDAADLDAGLKATVKAEGIAALAFVALTEKGELVGKFMTYYKTPHVFTDGELGLSVTIARQLGFSLERTRAEKERRSAEEAKELLLDESRHRIKNTLAMVQALAGQTLRRTPRAEREAFQARLRALGEAHDLLTSNNWDQAPLRDVVAHALKPFEGRHDARFVVQGPGVSLPARTSLMLTLCLHELATNAIKHGALSNGTGRVHLDWEPTDNGEQRKVRLSWRETGGPQVSTPQRKGFGSRLIETSFSGEGESCVEYRPDGLQCFLELSL
jgi:PAS domain S-box-containing protein